MLALAAGVRSAAHIRQNEFRAFAARSSRVPQVPAHGTESALRLESRQRDEGMW
jgi:hypothetical protein